MSQSELSDEHARRTAARVLRAVLEGKQVELTVDELVTLAIALDVPAADLVGGLAEAVSRARPAGRPPGPRPPSRP